MSFLDSLIYSFSNMFSVGPDSMDDDEGCCGGAGPDGTCCKVKIPEVPKKAVSVGTCQQKQEINGCHCSHDKPTLKLIKPLDRYTVCAIAMDQACYDLLLTSSVVLIALGDVDDSLDRLMGWMNEQILASARPLAHLRYGVFCAHEREHDLATIFEEKLHQLGGQRLHALGGGDWDAWTASIASSLATVDHTHDHPHGGGLSAGCTGGMIDVEDMDQIARQITASKKKRATERAVVNRRGRAKRAIGTPTAKAATTTQVTVSPITVGSL
ncbi:hypothetical protein BC940DRAFT_113533 [Gongronella butleri]|nr:hypothetical protein BC940DRAFT_113533 [Gongronella butleri]